MENRKIGKELHRLDVAIGRRLHQMLAANCCEDVSTGTHCRIIRFLSEHEDRDIYQRDLEKEFGITRSTASRVLTLMEQKELVVRSGVQHDARLKKLTLTEKARQYSDAMSENARDVDQHLMDGFTDAEKEKLLEFLDRMYHNMSLKG